jgi:hypothetical protein
MQASWLMTCRSFFTPEIADAGQTRLHAPQPTQASVIV